MFLFLFIMFIINLQGGGIMNEREITVKLKWELDEAKVYFVNAGIPLVESFVTKDIYLIKKEADINKMSNLDILSSCLIVRECIGNEHNKQLIYKDKKYDEYGNIIESTKYSCDVEDIDKTYELLTHVGFKECFRYEQECLAYANKDVDILLQYVPELGLFAELENNNKSINQLISDLDGLNIPYYENDYFVKKASLMLDDVRKYGR